MEKVKGFYMKKLMKKLNFAIIGLMVSASSARAASGADEALCMLAEKFGDIFSITIPYSQSIAKLILH